MRSAVQCPLADRITRGRIHGSSHPNGCLYTNERKERAGQLCTARVAQATSDYLHWAEPPSRRLWLLNCARDALHFMKPEYSLLCSQEPATDHILSLLLCYSSMCLQKFHCAVNLFPVCLCLLSLFLSLHSLTYLFYLCCATNRKIAGSIQDGVIGIFHWHNLSDLTMALGSTQPLTEMSTRMFSWG